MKARFCVLLLPVAIGGVSAAEPKARPRLTPPVVSEVKREAVQPARDAGTAPSFRSFDDFLQAEARRPPGLEAVRAPTAGPAPGAGAGETGPAAKDPNPTPARTDPEILVLPKVEVTAARITGLEKKLAALEANQSWEERSAEAWDDRTVVDAILNPPILKLGSYTGSGRAATARRRVDLLHWVRILRISQEEAKTPAEKARIQADIDGITGIMRMWE
jgi:hypothetical protein